MSVSASPLNLISCGAYCLVFSKKYQRQKSSSRAWNWFQYTALRLRNPNYFVADKYISSFYDQDFLDFSFQLTFLAHKSSISAFPLLTVCRIHLSEVIWCHSSVSFATKLPENTNFFLLEIFDLDLEANIWFWKIVFLENLLHWL